MAGGVIDFVLRVKDQASGAFDSAAESAQDAEKATTDAEQANESWSVSAGDLAKAAAAAGVAILGMLQHLADLSGHLIPQGLKGELAKGDVKANVYVYHMKPPYVSEIAEELKQLVPECHILEEGKEYSFPPIP